MMDGHGKGSFGLSTRTTTHQRMSRIPRITILCCKSPIVTADLGTSLYYSSGVPMQINKRLAGLQSIQKQGRLGFFKASFIH